MIDYNNQIQMIDLDVIRPETNEFENMCVRTLSYTPMFNVKWELDYKVHVGEINFVNCNRYLDAYEIAVVFLDQWFSAIDYPIIASTYLKQKFTLRVDGKDNEIYKLIQEEEKALLS